MSELIDWTEITDVDVAEQMSIIGDPVVYEPVWFRHFVTEEEALFYFDGQDYCDGLGGPVDDLRGWIRIEEEEE